MVGERGGAVPVNWGVIYVIHTTAFEIWAVAFVEEDPPFPASDWTCSGDKLVAGALYLLLPG